MSEGTMTSVDAEPSASVGVSETESLSIEQVEALLAEPFVLEPAWVPFAGDDTATWVYWTESDTQERGVPEEWVWERLRMRRDQLLAACDYRVVSDAPWDTAPWASYRQVLRDLPGNTTDPRQAMWPGSPAAPAA